MQLLILLYYQKKKPVAKKIDPTFVNTLYMKIFITFLLDFLSVNSRYFKKDFKRHAR